MRCRRGCQCSDCAPRGTVERMSFYARCPSGHQSVNVSHGRDSRGAYLQAWCSEPGCNAKQVVRKEAA